MADKPTAPDWESMLRLAIQQRDRAEHKANNLEMDLALAQQREGALQARLAELEQKPPTGDELVPIASSLNGADASAAG